MEISKTECKRILRTLELKAYRSVVDALRAQGALTKNKHEVLKNLAAALKVSEERYRSEMRRAANDDLLNTIAQRTSGENTEAEWRTESMKKVPFTPMVASQTAFTALADTISDIVALENEKLSNSSELKNVIESYKCRSEENLETYASSKVLSKLLQKRKNHHEDEILSELEKIKLNNNYSQPKVKSSYIEVCYDECSDMVETPAINSNAKTVSWKSDDEVYPMTEANSLPKSTSSKLSRKPGPKSRTKFIDLADKSADFCAKDNAPKQKLKPKNKMSKFALEDDIETNPLKQQNTIETRNLRTKPFKKYTLNSVEIQTFVDDDDEPEKKISKSKSMGDKSANNVNKITTQTELSHDSSVSNLPEVKDLNENANKIRNRKPKRRARGKTKAIRKSKIAQVRKLATSQRKKSESIKETPLRTSRISMRNARRRNYARMASGNDDLAEYKTPPREKKIEIEEVKMEEKDDEEETEVTDEVPSDSSSAPIEVSYNNLAPPKSSDYELENVSPHVLEDDMKPHTFNLIPASRRLKMLKKRAKSPSGDEIPAKKIALSPEIENDQNSSVTKSSNDINALRKVLAAHENMVNVSTCNASDLPETVKELLDISDHAKCSDLTKPSILSRSRDPERKINPPSAPIHSGGAVEKHTKPKIKLAEASTLENLSSLLSKVKEGDLKRLSNKNNARKSLSIRKDTIRKKPSPSTSSVESIRNANLIEVNNLETPSDTSSFGDENNCSISKENDSEDHIVIASNEEGNKSASQPSTEELTLSPFTTNDEVVSITMDEVEDVTESDVSEQLIDIESADIIISDNVDNNGDFTIVNDTNTVLASESKAEKCNESFKNIKLLEPPTTTNTCDNDNTESSKNDLVVNVEKNECIVLPNDVTPSDVTEKTATVLVDKAKLETKVKDSLPTASDFRYIADVDDPSLKKKPIPLLPKNSFIISKPSSIPISESGKITTIKTLKPIVLNTRDSVTTTKASPNLSKNIILTKSSLNAKERPFILLDTGSTLGSKSLLTSVKTLPKIIPVSNHANSVVNDGAAKPKKLAIYSSLKNINLTAISNISKTTQVKTTNVTSVLKQDDSPRTDVKAIKSNETLDNSKLLTAEGNGDTKRVILSQALENSLKSMESAIKNSVEESKASSNVDKMIEISSNDLSAEKCVPDKEFESSSLNDTTNLNQLKTFFSKNIIRKS